MRGWKVDGRSYIVTHVIVLQFQGANESALSLERLSGIVRSGDRKSPTTGYQEQREPGQSK